MPNKKQVIIFSLTMLVGLLLTPIIILGANLMSNDGLEAPFVQYGEYNGWKLQVAHDWERFELESDRLRFFSSCDWAAFNGGPVCEKRDGEDAQVWWSSKDFDVGIYQQVPGLTIGEIYGFQAGVLQVWEQTTSKTDGKMFRMVGIDPTGGIDPESPNVLWSPQESLDVDWFYPGVGAEAMSTTMTVFVRVISPDDASTPHSNQVWVDDTFFDIAPATTIAVEMTSETEATANWQGTPRIGFQTDPFAYEAQYRLVTETTWTNLQYFDSSTAAADIPTGTSATFTVNPNLEYVVRARTWHEQDGGDGHEVPGPWAEASFGGIPPIPTGDITGTTLDNQGYIFPKANVIITDLDSQTTSAEDGSFSLSVISGTHTITANNSSGWHTLWPMPLTVVISETISTTLDLIPPNNIIRNSTFEAGLSEWQTTLSQTNLVSTTSRNGLAVMITKTTILTQQHTIANAFKPTLTFWYNFGNADSVSALTAEVIGRNTLTPTHTLVFTQNTSGWQRVVLPLNLAEFEETQGGTLGTPVLPVPTTYSGPIKVRFTFKVATGSGSILIKPTVYLDDVVLGSSQPEDTSVTLYLPVTMKSYSPPTVAGCPTTSTASFDLIPPEGDAADHPDSLHGDFNLAQRSYVDVSETLGLVTYNGTPDPNAPWLPGLFSDDRTPTFVSTHQVYDWDWSCGDHGCQGNLLNQYPVTLLGMETTSGESIQIPTNRGSDIYLGTYHAMVLYAEEERLTITYTRQDKTGAADGYVVHFEGFCVDPNLLALYQAQVGSDGYRVAGYGLPGLSNNQTIGTTLGDSIKIAIRDRGTFHDPRSQADWW